MTASRSDRPTVVDPRTPVLVGVGVAHRPVDGSGDVEALDLMAEAARTAADDAGAPSLLDRLGLVAVTEGNTPYADPAGLLASRVGAHDARTVRVDVGVPQCTPLRVAAERIRAGGLDVALVAGGEALASQRAAERAGRQPRRTAEAAAAGPAERWAPEGELMAEPEIAAGMWSPVEHYAVIENARRHALGRTAAEHLDAVAALWERFNVVARNNPSADFGEPRDAAFLRASGPGNRPLAFPYAKWHVTQWTVDQAAALLLCSAAAADAAGVPRDRWVFPHVVLESSLSVSLSRREQLHRWPAMQVLGEAAAAHLGRPLSTLELVEIYSCFPSAVAVQAAELGLGEGSPLTVTGGMAFAGGPLNNFTYQATAEVVPGLRERPDALGLVTTVSGLLTKPGLAVWGAAPPGDGALLADLADRAAARTEVRGVTGGGSGPATVAGWTTTYEGDEPTKVFVIADLPDGRRWVGTSHDADLVARSLVDDLTGAPVAVTGPTCHPSTGE